MQSGVDLFSRPPSAGENEDENEVDRRTARNDGDSLDRMRRYRLTEQPLD